MHTHDTPDAGRQATLHAIRDRNQGLDGQTQRARLLEALHELGSITTFEASRHLDVYHPPARAKELRDDGHQITTLRRRVVTEAGAAHSVGVYLLVRRPKLEGEQ
jgi:Helix-turn-helix domain